MKRKIIKFGNAKGITISPKFLKALGVDVGDTVELNEYNGQLLISCINEPTNDDLILEKRIFNKFNGVLKRASEFE